MRRRHPRFTSEEITKALLALAQYHRVHGPLTGGDATVQAAVDKVVSVVEFTDDNVALGPYRIVQ